VFAIRPRIRRALLAIRDWRFSRVAITYTFAPIKVQFLSERAIDECYAKVDRVANRLRKHHKVVGFLVKFEAAVGETAPDGSPCIALHFHADVMMHCQTAQASAAIAKACCPSPSNARLYPADKKWIGYLAKPSPQNRGQTQNHLNYCDGRWTAGKPREAARSISGSAVCTMGE